MQFQTEKNEIHALWKKFVWFSCLTINFFFFHFHFVNHSRNIAFSRSLTESSVNFRKPPFSQRNFAQPYFPIYFTPITYCSNKLYFNYLFPKWALLQLLISQISFTFTPNIYFENKHYSNYPWKLRAFAAVYFKKREISIFFRARLG